MKLQELQIGFIGSGRVTNILLGAWLKHEMDVTGMLVYDAQPGKSENLALQYPGIKTVESITELVKKSQTIFLAIHPPEVAEVLNQIRSSLTDNKFLIPLAPKITIEKIQQGLNSQIPVARIIPNAPTITGHGYNVFSLSPEVNQDMSDLLNNLFLALGSFKQVEENLLESYATITGMGPTYIWFLFNELYQQALKTGLAEEEANTALNEMIKGASETLFNSGLPYDQVCDLIPSYPLKPHEENIQKIYAETISKLFGKLNNG